MDCETPWDGDDSNTTQQNCSSTEDLKKYFDLRLDIYRGKYKKELDECLIPNCFENHWNYKHLAKLSGNAFLYQHGKDVKDVQMYHFSSSKKVKFICSEKATKFCEIFTLLLSYVVPVKSKVEDFTKRQQNV
jgi:hypothetical protein